MRRVTGALATVAITSGWVLAPVPAGAATGEFGNTCTASSSVPNTTVLMSSGGPGNPIPATPPFGGVITKARFSLPATPTQYPTKLKVLRSNGTFDQYRVVAESAPLVVVGGSSSFDVRVPVAAGDFLGLSGASGGQTLLCATPSASDAVAYTSGDPAPGAVSTYTTVDMTSLPVVATVEQDGDGDGFGDVTQDLCPRSAAYQRSCPAVHVESSASAQNRAVTVVVSVDNTAVVLVTATAKASGRTIRFRADAVSLAPGVLTKIRLSLPNRLRNAVAALPRTKHVTVVLTTSATDSIGQVTADQSRVRLRGKR